MNPVTITRVKKYFIYTIIEIALQKNFLIIILTKSLYAYIVYCEHELT